MRVAVTVVAIFLTTLAWGTDSQVLVATASSQEIQNNRADDDDLSRMHDLAMLHRFVQAGYLVRVPSRTRSYYLHTVSVQYQYCRPWAKLFLERLSRQFYAKFKQPLRVTSLVRTVSSQVRLSRTNGNAADAFGPLRSSHLTGASLDISKHSMSAEARTWLRTVLYSLREKGYLYAIEEFDQPTFHIMVYKNYPGYVKALSRAHTRKTLIAKSGEEEKAD